MAAFLAGSGLSFGHKWVLFYRFAYREKKMQQSKGICLRAPNKITLHSNGLFRFWAASGCIDHRRMACFAFLARNENARFRSYDLFCKALLILMISVAVCGCKKEKVESEYSSTKEEQIRKEAVMGITIQWLGHASFRICYEDKVIYIDPWKLKEPVGDATLVLVSHSHYDHYSAEDIAKVSGAKTKLIASADVVTKEKAGEAILPGLTIELDGIRVMGVPAYNPDKQYHPKRNNWTGFIVEVGAKRIYYAGDTDLTEEMKALKDIDVALLPVGGTYTMSATEAAEATSYIRPELVIPYHWGDIVGGRSDAEQFGEQVQGNVKILSPGETLIIEE